MAALSAAQIADYAISAGFTGDAINIAVAIALAESSGDPAAIGDIDAASGPSYGLWQINAIHAGAERAIDPKIGAAMAYQISHGGTNWRPWTTYRTGAYRRYLPQTPTMDDMRGTHEDDNEGIVSVSPPTVQVPAGPTVVPASPISGLHVAAGGAAVTPLAIVIQWIFTWPIVTPSDSVALSLAGLIITAGGYVWHMLPASVKRQA